MKCNVAICLEYVHRCMGYAMVIHRKSLLLQNANVQTGTLFRRKFSLLSPQWIMLQDCAYSLTTPSLICYQSCLLPLTTVFVHPLSMLVLPPLFSLICCQSCRLHRQTDHWFLLLSSFHLAICSRKS